MLKLLKPADQIEFDPSKYNEEAEYFQLCLKRLDFKDKNETPLDSNGYFDSKSMSALKKFLDKYKFTYFGLKAKEKLLSLAESTANFHYDIGFEVGKLKLSPIAFVYGNIRNIHKKNDPFHSMAVLKSFPYIITTHPGKLDYISKRITEVIKVNTKLFGYVNLGPNNPEDPRNSWKYADIDSVKKEIDIIAASGWYGVFIDQFGYDFNETRKRQNEVVDYIHNKRLKCMVNAWFPEDALDNLINTVSNPDGSAIKLARSDWYLVESFFVSTAGYRDDNTYLSKYLKIRSYQQKLGINIAVLSYVKNNESMEQAKNDETISYILAQCLGFEGWWFGGFPDVDSFVYGKDPNIDIGNEMIEHLKFDSNARYIARTNKYIIEYYAADTPYIVLKSLSKNINDIIIGKI